ncbi:hypothetical protein [Serratia fonticola]
MEIILNGGPYDGQKSNPRNFGDHPIPPFPFLRLAPPLSEQEKYIGGSELSKKTYDILLYELKEIWQNGRFHHYEYHFQDR